MSNNDNYIAFEPSRSPLYNDSSRDRFYLFNNGNLLIKLDNEECIIPERYEIEEEYIKEIKNFQTLGAYKGFNSYTGEVEQVPEKEGFEFIELRDYSRRTSEELFLVAAKARVMHNYMLNNNKCGVCGHPMEDMEDDEKARYCPRCKHAVWPTTSPAIIVAVTKGDKLLMGHNVNFPEGRYSVLAGFVEMGETFEDCVRREVFEETGIKVKNIEYFGSQPWPFPNSMMIGFTAEYLEGDIEVDEVEILHADWFTKDQVREMHRESISISSKLINWFLNREDIE